MAAKTWFCASPEEIAHAKQQILRICRQTGLYGASMSMLSYHRNKIGIGIEDRTQLLAEMVGKGELVVVVQNYPGARSKRMRYYLSEIMAKWQAEMDAA